MEDEGEGASVSVRSFVAARAQEIFSLSLQIEASSGVKNKGLAFQHVPKHMRRRAVSHNAKRLPKRLQESHLNQLTKSSGGVVKKPKKPSRKHRRRKSNLLHEYNRRQKNVKWTETHIWHAKRFHMCSKWGYKIPISPCDKGSRALYRSFKNHAAIQDISYYSSLQISGPSSLISSTFTKITPPQLNPLSLNAIFYKNSHRHGNLHIYAPNSFPYSYIGNFNCMWIDGDKLWIWTHPALKNQLIDTLVNIFELEEEFKITVKKSCESSTNEKGDNFPLSTNSKKLHSKKLNKLKQNLDIFSNSNKTLTIDEIKALPKTNIKTPTKWTNLKTGIQMTDLEFCVNRFRIYGPKSTQVLQEVLKIKKTTQILNEKSKNIKEKGDDMHEISKNSEKRASYCEKSLNFGDKTADFDESTKNCEEKSSWYKEYYSIENNKNNLDLMSNFWENLPNFDQYPSYAVLPLTVRDPRVFLPKKRCKIFEKSQNPQNLHENMGETMETDDLEDDKNEIFLNFLNRPIESPLSCPEIRTKILNEKMSDFEMSKRRGEHLIPGSELDLGDDENEIPVILVQIPNFGWDLILPNAWAMPFWIAFSYRCVRAFGERDIKIHAFEFDSIHSPVFFPPDSLIGKNLIISEGDERKNNYFKYPPAKRQNFIKLKSPFPFYTHFNTLLQFNYNLLKNGHQNLEEVIKLEKGQVLGQLLAEGHNLVEGQFSTEGQSLEENQGCKLGQNLEEDASLNKGQISKEGQFLTKGQNLVKGQISTEGQSLEENQGCKLGHNLEENASLNKGQVLKEGQNLLKGQFLTEGQLYKKIQIFTPNQILIKGQILDKDSNLTKGQLLKEGQDLEKNEDETNMEEDEIYTCEEPDKTDIENLSNFYVLRDWKILKELKECVKSGNLEKLKEIVQKVENPENCLIGVRLKCFGKGTIGTGSLICIPHTGDFNFNSSTEAKSTNSKKCKKVTLKEPLFETPYCCPNIDKKKKELRRTHQKMLALLRKKRKKIRKRQDFSNSQNEDSSKNVSISNLDSSSLCSSYKSKIELISTLPCSSMLKIQKRVPIGIISLGRDLLHEGVHSGIGFITLIGLIAHIQINSINSQFLLVRNSNETLKYFGARLQISINN